MTTGCCVIGRNGGKTGDGGRCGGVPNGDTNTGGVGGVSREGRTKECVTGEPCGVGVLSSAEKSESSEGSGVVSECSTA